MQFKDTPLSEQVAHLRHTTQPLTHGSKADLYLRGRGLDLETFPRDLRQDAAGNMVAVIRDSDGVGVSYQTTLLPVPDKGLKRLMAPGIKIPDGASIRLFKPCGTELGVAEGVENAISAHELTGVATWSAVSAEGLKRWLPPPGVSSLYVFADHDLNEVGQLAAQACKRSSEMCYVEVHVLMPQRPGDWNDFLMADKGISLKMFEPRRDEPRIEPKLWERSL